MNITLTGLAVSCRKLLRFALGAGGNQEFRSSISAQQLYKTINGNCHPTGCCYKPDQPAVPCVLCPSSDIFVCGDRRCSLVAGEVPHSDAHGESVVGLDYVLDDMRHGRWKHAGWRRETRHELLKARRLSRNAPIGVSDCISQCGLFFVGKIAEKIEKSSHQTE